MTTPRPAVGLFRVLKNDYFTMIALGFAGGVWMLPLAGQLEIVPPNAVSIPIMAGVATLASVALLAVAGRRISTIKRVVERGTEVKGTVTHLYFHRDRGRVDYRYDVGGKSYEAGTAIFKNAETQRLTPGKELALIVDPDDPSTAFVASLYAA